MMLQGKGFFIWKIRNCENGDIQAIANIAARDELTHVLIKIADGAYSYNIDPSGVDLVPGLVKALHKHDIQAWGWQYLYGNDPIGEANKAIVIITDGENHEDDALASAQAALDEGAIVHTIGMGLPSGSPIPVFRNGQTDYLKDRDGNVVVTKLNEQMLEEIAASGGGIYVRANNAQVGLNALFDEINKMEKQEMETRSYSEYDDQFQYFFAVGLFLLLLEFVILERKNKYLKRIKLFG